MRWLTRMCFSALALGLLSNGALAGGLTSIAAMTSTVMQEGQSSFSGLGLRAQVTSDRLMQGFSLLPTTEHCRNSSGL